MPTEALQPLHDAAGEMQVPGGMHALLCVEGWCGIAVTNAA